MERANRQRVVVVDDEPDVLTSLHMLLDQCLDAEIVAFASADDALETIADGHVDVLLADYRMPGMDGLELIRRGREIVPHLGAMMITAYRDMDVVIRAINEGRIVHFFPKPADPDRLVGAVRLCLRDLRRLGDRRAAFERALERGREAIRRELQDGAPSP